jgi:hypothetical protein
MELRRELLLTIGLLVLLNLCLAFGAIGLLVRMGPASELILEENVYSLVAADEMLAELAHAGGAPLAPQARERALQALDNARRNQTEEAEQPVLAALEARLPAALDGDPAAREQTVVSIQQLIRINRQAMRAVDEEARRLGSAGAWAAVLLGFLSFLLSIGVIARLQSRFVRPLVDLHAVLQAAVQGDRLRRCRPSVAPREVIAVTESVNRLLDERLERSQRDATPPSV